ncbi:MAG: glycosyltransferase family 4 protein [Microlunatus sp.]
MSDAVYPWNTGGKEMRIQELMSRAACRGFDVDIYTMRWWEGHGDHRQDALRYRAIARRRPLYAGRRRSIRQAASFCLATWRLLFRGFDLMDADAIPFLHLVPLAIVARIRRRPMVVTWHEFWGRDYWVDYLGRFGALAAAIERGCLYLPTRIIAASQGTADRIIDETRGRIQPVVIPNGVDLSSVVELSAAPGEQLAAGAHRLLFVGRLLSHKNADVAIEATKLLRSRGLDVELTIIGEGPEDDRLRVAAGADLDQSITIRPFIPDRTDLLREIAAAEILLFPSVREGFGMVALESMALGTPVITSDHPDNHARALVTPGVTGDVCPPVAAAFADAVERCLEGLPGRSEAARRAAHSYDWDELADRLVEVYRHECEAV